MLLDEIIKIATNVPMWYELSWEFNCHKGKSRVLHCDKTRRAFDYMKEV